MFKLAKLVAGMGVLLACTSTWAGNWGFDASNASLRFLVGGLGGANGKFTAFNGVVKYDPAQLKDLKVNLNIDATSMDAGAKTIAYRGESVFYIEKYKSLNFTSTQVVPLSKNTAKLKGILTLRGVSRPIEWDVKLDPSKDEKSVVFKAVTSIQRSLWKVDGYSAVASDKVDLIIQGRLLPTES